MEHLERHMERMFNSGDVIFKEGDPGGEIYIVKSGKLKVYLEREDQEIQLAELGKGELIGAMTASTQTTRSASVRALTDVTLTVIENTDVEKLLKNMPLWASILIKDLVFRLKFMNELYVLSIMQDTDSLQTKPQLRSAVRLAKGILANARAHLYQHENDAFVDLNSAVSPLVDIFLKEKGTFQRIFDLFLKSKLVELKNLSAPGKYMTKGELWGLNIFCELTNQYLATPDSDASRAFPTLSERKTLMELSNWAKAEAKTESQSEAIDVIKVETGHVEDKLAVLGVKRPNIFAMIQTAENHHMLTIHKDTGRISIYPDKMRQILASMYIIMELDED